MNNLFNIPHLLSTYGYAGIAVIVFLESGIFFALPGDSLLFTAGLLASVLHLSLPILISIVFISTILGSLAGYYIGFHLTKLQKYKVFRKILSKEHLDKTHAFFERHGKLAVFFSHFLPIFRTFVPIVAGMANMRYRVFVGYTILSALAWSTVVTLAGYFLGQVFPNADHYLWFIVILTVMVSMLPVFYGMIRKRKKKIA